MFKTNGGIQATMVSYYNPYKMIFLDLKVLLHNLWWVLNILKLYNREEKVSIYLIAIASIGYSVSYKKTQIACSIYDSLR